MHWCSEEEFTRFYEVDNENDAKEVAQLQAEGHFYCMNWKELPDELFGYWRSGSDYTHFDAMVVPCASTEDKACIQDKL